MTSKNSLSIGSPLTNQVTEGRGAPSERHTNRPFSSGANTKSLGFSNQNGAAFKCKYGSLNVIVLYENKELHVSEGVSHLWPWRLLCAQCSRSYWWPCTCIHRCPQTTPSGFESSCWSSLISCEASPSGRSHPWARWCEESALMMTNQALHRMTYS